MTATIIGAEDDMDAALADNIRRKGAHFRETDLNADDEYDFDGGIEMYESRKKKGTKVRCDPTPPARLVLRTHAAAWPRVSTVC